MRLLVVSHYFWPENFRINDLVAELVGRGHEVTVLTGKPNYPEGRLFPEFLENPKKFANYKGARILRVPIWPRGRGRLRLLLNYLSYVLSAILLGILRLRGEQFDAIFVFEPSPVTVGLPAIVLRRLKHCPMAFWVLDQWPETLSAVGVVKSKKVLRLVGRFVSFIYSRCDLILAQSKGLVSQIERYCDHQKPIAYFPNWVESVYGDHASTPAPEVSVQKGSFNVMFAGNIGEAQDFSSILNAAEQLKNNRDIRWLVVGDGCAAPWVKKEVSRRGLEDNFILLGQYSPDRMPSFYRHADALLVSLKSDPIFAITIPGKLQSYLAFSLPILGMLDGEGARIIEEAKVGLVNPAGDSKQLGENVLRMAAMTKKERLRMGMNGRAYSKREFDRDMLIKRLEESLERLSLT